MGTEGHSPELYATATRWLPAVLVAALTSWAALAAPAHARLSDLRVYVGAINGVRDGASLYDFVSGNGAPFTYPPFAALALWPVTRVGTSALQVGWTAATIVTVGLLAVLAAQHAVPVCRATFAVACPRGERRGPSLRSGAASLFTAPALALALMLSAPVSSDVRFGQVSIFLAAMVAVDVLVLRDSRHQGILLGIAAAVKLTPLIFIPLLWWAGRRRAAAMATAAFLACGALAALLLPGDTWRYWSTEMFQVSRLGPIASAGNQSINGALLRLGVDLSLRAVTVLIIGGAVAAAAVWRAAQLARRDQWFAALVVAGAAGVVLSPVSWTHHQIWLVLAAALPVAGPRWAKRAWMTVTLAVMLLPVTALGGPVWENVRLLLAVVVALLVPLARTPHPATGAAAPTEDPDQYAEGDQRRTGRAWHAPPSRLLQR